VVNRAGFDPAPYNEATRNNIPKGFDDFGLRWLLSGPDLSYVAERERVVRGRVFDADTGAPRAGVAVSLSRDGNALLSVTVGATTDADGKYEIRGARKAKTSYMVEVPGDPAAGYLPAQARTPDSPGYDPVTVDVRMKKAVVITGRVVEKGTGKPVPGIVWAGVLTDNPFVKDFPEFDSSAAMRSEYTADDGTFRIVTIPGPVILMGGPDGQRTPDRQRARYRYKPPVPDPNYPQYFPKERGLGGAYYTLNSGITPIQGNFCKVLEVKPGSTTVEQDVILEPASALKVKIRDADGKPLTGVWATGFSPQDWHRAEKCAADECTAYDVQPDKPRLMVFFEPDRKLVGTITLKGDEKEPAAKLGPAGSVNGRLVGPDGKPAAGVVVTVGYQDRAAAEIHDVIYRTREVVTAADGSFAFDDLVPGVGFRLWHHRNQRVERSRKVSDETIRVKPGEALGLGDLKLAPAPGGG
jgi:5-hydroxyisourate hydrolase-like protein (transthyretin family)